MLREYWFVLAFSALAGMISVAQGHVYLLVLFLGWLLFIYYLKKVNFKLVIVALIICFASYVYLPPPQAPPSNSLSIQSQSEKQIKTGKITSPLIEKERTVTFDFQTNDEKKWQVTYFKNDANDYLPNFVQHGASCRLSGEVSPALSATNPHQFDYQNYLWQQGIQAQFLISHIEDIECENKSLRSSIYDFRQFLKETTENNLSENTVQWLHALVLGDDTLLDDSIVDVFRRWGLSHILAISGLHIGIVVGLIYFCFVRLNILTKEKAKLFLCLFLPVYALIAGGQPSVWRASLMVMIAILLSFLKRKISYTDLISIIFILFILFDKYIIYHIGFQLSFAVTFGIILSQKWVGASNTSLESLLKISFVSQMVILPLQIHYFSIFDPSSILLNLIVVPYFTLFAIPILFLLLFLSFIPSGLTRMIEFVFHFFHEKLLTCIIWVDAHFHFPFIIGKLPLFFIVAYYILFVVFMMALENKPEKYAFSYGVVLCLYISFLALRPYFSPYGTVTMLDIGQGDAFIIEMPYRKAVYFVDIGAELSFPDNEKNDKEYLQIIRPYLYGQGIHKVDAVFLSHEHLDHYGSLPYLLNDLQVNEIVMSHFYEIDSDQLKSWTEQGTKVTKVMQGDVIHHQKTIFHVLSPRKKTDSADDNSLVLLTNIGNKDWVFTGDIGKTTERDIINTFPQLKADILKVAHHGSDTSSDSQFVNRFEETAFISVGRDNMYNHPNDEVIDTLKDEGLEVYRTDEHGAVQYRFKGEKGFFKTFLSAK